MSRCLGRRGILAKRAFSLAENRLREYNPLKGKVSTGSSSARNQLNSTVSHEKAGIRFDDLNLSKPLLDVLHHAKYHHPTPIQAQLIPHGLAGRDVIGQAQTGTGK